MSITHTMKQNYDLEQNEIKTGLQQKFTPKRVASISSNHAVPPKQSTSSISSIDSGVFTICNPSRLEGNVFESRTTQAESPSYTRHSYLDLRQLSFRDRFHLARLHYVTLPNGIRLLAVLFCFCMFAYVARTTFEEFIHRGTIVHLEYQSPNTSMPPAITICTHCVLCK